jgi:hypothetical protein
MGCREGGDTSVLLPKQVVGPLVMQMIRHRSLDRSFYMVLGRIGGQQPCTPLLHTCFKCFSRFCDSKNTSFLLSAVRACRSTPCLTFHAGLCCCWVGSWMARCAGLGRLPWLPMLLCWHRKQDHGEAASTLMRYFPDCFVRTSGPGRVRLPALQCAVYA